MERVTCAQENCGTFVMDEELYNKLKRTGETFYCPEGHPQHFTETTANKLRSRISDLKEKIERVQSRLDRKKEMYHDARDQYFDESERRNFVESMLLSEVVGVVEVAPEQWKWSCACGSHGQKAFDDRDDAQAAYRKHLRRQDCSDGQPEHILTAENGGISEDE